MEETIYYVNGKHGEERLVVPLEVLQDKLKQLKAKFPGSIREERKLVVYKKSEIYEAIDNIFSEVINCGTRDS